MSILKFIQNHGDNHELTNFSLLLFTVGFDKNVTFLLTKFEKNELIKEKCKLVSYK